MRISEAYAINVMPWAIAKLAFGDKTYWKDELERLSSEIEDRRSDFMGYLEELEDADMVFGTQVDAWNDYKENAIVYSDEDFDYLDDDTPAIDRRPPSWEEEQRDFLHWQIRPENYDEFGGQQ